MANQKLFPFIEHPTRKVPRGVKLLSTFDEPADTILSIAFHPSGQSLISGGLGKILHLWDVNSGELLRSFEGHNSIVPSVAFDLDGRTLASGSNDGTARLWDTSSGRPIRTIKAHGNPVWSVAFDPAGRMLATGSHDGNVKLWATTSRELLHTLPTRGRYVYSVAFDPQGLTLASGGHGGVIEIWDTATGDLLRTLEDSDDTISSVAFDPAGRMLATGKHDGTVRLYEVASGRLLLTLEGHLDKVGRISFSPDGELLASKSTDGTVRLWSCDSWETVAVIPVVTPHNVWVQGLAFHRTLPLLAASGTMSADMGGLGSFIRIWELDLHALLGKSSKAKPVEKAVHHTTAKIVLVGDHSVGKSGLGWRLAHGEFKEQSSTHGQQFWVLTQLSMRRQDGTECEAILWDLAGQPDYRLIHALFLDDVDLALVLFDSSDIHDPLHGVEFWLKQLKGGRVGHSSKANAQQDAAPIILVGAQADRGTPTLTLRELKAFCRGRGISSYLSTSAKEGWGLEELVQRMKKLIRWEEKAATVTTATFKRIKDYVLNLKENRRRKKIIVSPQELRNKIEKTVDAGWRFTDAEMMTAVGHLENYGYVKRLRTSKGEDRILFTPELLNNLAASFVLEARRNPKGLGSLEEKQLMEDGYSFPELVKLSLSEREILLDSAALLFLEHNICFRETGLNGQSYLVFPELINLKKPMLDNESSTEDAVSYTVSGAVENVYASLVVLLGYTQTFTRTNQWRNLARYEVGDGLICGFRQEADRDGELDFVLYFGTHVGKPVRTLFQGLFESFLARRNLSVIRYEPVVCSNGHSLNRAVVRDELRSGGTIAFCSRCGERLILPSVHEPIQLTQTERRKVDEQRWVADQRTRFEQAVFQLASYVETQGLYRPVCFISYAWGDREQERWVELNLAKDIQKASVGVVLDRWENDRAGKSVSRFVSRISKCNIVICVGTPLYFEKFENKVSNTGSVVASEVDLISQRLMGTEEEKETVMPILLAGKKRISLPPLMWDRVHRDFRKERAYFITAFDLILDLYKIDHNDTAVADLRETLRDLAIE